MDRHTLWESFLFTAMATDHFYLFAALASFSAEVQEQLRQVDSPEAIVEIAAHYGFEITLKQLSYYAPRLNGDHWIWARKGESWRASFLAGEHQLRLQTA
ncbi:MAG: hypothetical protein ER33_04750 [Cyanobium sp. CACIAM 14]|nr:MAG: hypothetical protein ER33_04750 [Cyanobium sp. CACIAM 14]